MEQNNKNKIKNFATLDSFGSSNKEINKYVDDICGDKIIMTKNKEFIQQIETIYAQGIEIIKNKNHDYAEDSDPFKNFRYSELLGISIERAILVRIMDKIARISNLLDKEAKVKDEKIEDTLIDAINYLAILLTYIKLERKK